MVAQGSCSKHPGLPAQPPAGTINSAFGHIHLKLQCAKRFYRVVQGWNARKAENHLEHMPCEASIQAWMSAGLFYTTHMSFHLQVLKIAPHDRTIKKKQRSARVYLIFTSHDLTSLIYLPTYLLTNLSHVWNFSNKVVNLKYLSTYLPSYFLTPNYVSMNLSSFLRIYVSQIQRIS